MLTSFQIDKIISETKIQYNHFTNNFETPVKPIFDIDNYLSAVIRKVLITQPKQQDIEDIKDYLYKLFDFDEYSYREYFRHISKTRNRKLLDEIQKSYNKYLEQISTLSKHKQVIYINGLSGSGKTTYAKILGRKLYGDDEIYITSGGKNQFDEYYGEKCIIVDDFRDSNMPFSDLLKLLDNNTSSSVGARYNNKSLARCELIILTSVIPVEELYRGVGEDIFQLYRRIKYFKIENKTLYNLKLTVSNGFIQAGHKHIQEELNNYFNEHKTNETDIEKFIDFIEN